jgi:hypothetical protein
MDATEKNIFSDSFAKANGGGANRFFQSQNQNQNQSQIQNRSQNFGQNGRPFLNGSISEVLRTPGRSPSW